MRVERGKIAARCLRCAGKGQLAIILPGAPAMHFKTTCPACHGQGAINLPARVPAAGNGNDYYRHY